MLETAPHEHNYLIDHLDEIEAVIVDLSFNVRTTAGWCTAPPAAMNTSTCLRPTSASASASRTRSTRPPEFPERMKKPGIRRAFSLPPAHCWPRV